MTNGKYLTILVVEDDPGVARLQQRRLEAAGYQVICTGTAEEGVQHVRQGSVELVLMDYRLPGGRTGLDVYMQLKAAGHDVPVILITGFSDQSTVIQALRLGVRDFVPKSNDYMNYLPEAVGRVLKQISTERQLAQSEARLAGIISSAMDAIITVDGEQHITLFNPAAEQVFRSPAALAVGRPLGKFIPATADGTISLFGQADKPEYVCADRLELSGVRADGQHFPLEASIACTVAGGQKYCIVIVRDVSDRKRDEERLHEQAALLDSATNAIFVRDLDGLICYWNPASERLYGWTAQEAIGKDSDEILFRTCEPGREEAEQTLHEKGEWSEEVRQVTRNGKEILVESHWTLLRGNDGQPKKILVINTDVTQKRQLETQFLRAQRMECIGTLAGGIAHDLNNVLTPILMATELLEGVVPQQARDSLLVPVRTCAQRGAEMVKEILLFARGVEGQRSELQLRYVIPDIEKMLQHTLPKSITLTSSVAKNLDTVLADATQLSQVLMNLCLNARDAMPQGGRLTITADNVTLGDDFARLSADARSGAYVRLTVADTGTGMPAEILERIFDPFFTTKEQGKGTGLGLSTALGIVKSHGGFIHVESEIGVGTRFEVYLPATAREDAAKFATSTGALPCGDGDLILLVDDEAAVREIASATLISHGYRVVCARDGAEAVAFFVQRKDEIGAVITDMVMPVMDGTSTARALRRINPAVPIIMSSGLLGNTNAAVPSDAGVQALLQKPYTAEELILTIRSVLDGRPSPSDGAAQLAANAEKRERVREQAGDYAGVL